MTFFHIFNLASTISESQVEYIKVHETWNVNHKSKFGFQDEGIKKVGLGNLDCEAHCPNRIFGQQWANQSIVISQTANENIMN